MPSPRRVQSGFTLIELLVVVAIIALLISILLPSLARAREQAKLAKCVNNLHNLSTAVLTFAADHNGYAQLIGRPHDPNGYLSPVGHQQVFQSYNSRVQGMNGTSGRPDALVTILVSTLILSHITPCLPLPPVMTEMPCINRPGRKHSVILEQGHGSLNREHRQTFPLF